MERHWRDEAGEWRSETLVGDGRVSIPVLDIELTLDEVYDGVELTPVDGTEASESA